ncbi:7869_t:CDS:10, partial [Funneliformis geosporum]
MEAFSFISPEVFEELIAQYTNSLKNKNKYNIHLIDQNTYDDIKKFLLGGNVQDANFKRWARAHFTYITVGNDHVVHISFNNRTTGARNNVNKNIRSLPVLIKENMYKVFCLAHTEVSHKKIASTYEKLRNEWGNINKKLVELFCENCSICAIRVNRKFSNEVAGKAIIARNFLSRLQQNNEIENINENNTNEIASLFLENESNNNSNNESDTNDSENNSNTSDTSKKISNDSSKNNSDSSKNSFEIESKNDDDSNIPILHTNETYPILELYEWEQKFKYWLTLFDSADIENLIETDLNNKSNNAQENLSETDSNNESDNEQENLSKTDLNNKSNIAQKNLSKIDSNNESGNKKENLSETDSNNESNNEQE